MFKFSLVSAVYGVEKYLPDFLESLDKQTFDHSKIEVILVNDGTKDKSVEIIKEWIKKTDFKVLLIEQENAGQGAARNHGIEHATGEWITFPDPDDFLEKDYFRKVLESIEKHSSAALVVSRLRFYQEKTRSVSGTHPLDFRFKGRNFLRDIDRFPRNIHLSGATAFFKLATLKGFEFNTLIRPIFEDAYLIQKFLLHQSKRKMLLVPDAEYFYRKREDSSSSVQGSAIDDRRYTTVLEHGYLAILKEAANKGKVPIWLQNVVLYDLFWIFKHSESLFPRTGTIKEKTATRFVSLMKEIRKNLDVEVIENFDIFHISNITRDVMLHAFSENSWHENSARVTEFDHKRGLVQISYRFTGSLPDEKLFVQGRNAVPLFSKTRAHKYLGKSLLSERHIWTSSKGIIQLFINNKCVDFVFSEPKKKIFDLKQTKFSKEFHFKNFKRSSTIQKLVSSRKALDKKQKKEINLIKKASSSKHSKQYAGAWVFKDRDDKALDNAEHLFKYVTQNHPEINAWYTIEKDTPDWKRLKKEGITNLVAYGSDEWKILCLNATKIISSHAEKTVYEPFKFVNGIKPKWDFVFLQHGVTKDDLSGWLNHKPINIFITATSEEYRSIAGDGSAYRFDKKVTKLTGFPRFDRLHTLDKEKHNPTRKSSITIMPTWRSSINNRLSASTSVVEKNKTFLHTDFAQEWLNFLQSAELKSLADRYNKKIRFMPHPNMEPYLDSFKSVPNVEILTYANNDIQQILVESDIVITDFSSVAFDAAFLDRKIIYFQFDAKDIFGGGHTMLPGYFSYDEHGFGPVAESIPETLNHLELFLANSHPQKELFLERKKQTFTIAKTNNCKRVLKEILRLDEPISASKATRFKKQKPLIADPTRYLS